MMVVMMKLMDHVAVMVFLNVYKLHRKSQGCSVPAERKCSTYNLVDYMPCGKLQKRARSP